MNKKVFSMNKKEFSMRFNRELTVLGFPEELKEKVVAVSRVFGVTRYLANAMIVGDALPSEDNLMNIAKTLEVCPHWLSGRTDKKKGSAREFDEDRV